MAVAGGGKTSGTEQADTIKMLTANPRTNNQAFLNPMKPKPSEPVRSGNYTTGHQNVAETQGQFRTQKYFLKGESLQSEKSLGSFQENHGFPVVPFRFEAQIVELVLLQIFMSISYSSKWHVVIAFRNRAARVTHGNSLRVCVVGERPQANHLL